MMGIGPGGERPHRSGIWRHVSPKGIAVAGASALLLLGATVPLASAKTEGSTTRVIVMSTKGNGDSKKAGDNVRKHHGNVVSDFDAADSVLADVTDAATTIAGVKWAIQNKDTYGIDVLNISMGMPPFPSSVNNPLDRAVERAWNQGIVVVTSAGNTGPMNGTITSPGDDPLVITAG